MEQMEKFSDEQLLQEFHFAQNAVSDKDAPEPEPDELRKILKRVNEEREK